MLLAVSHPVHVLVMGPGGYKFGDYAHNRTLYHYYHFPATMIMVPFFWPL